MHEIQIFGLAPESEEERRIHDRMSRVINPICDEYGVTCCLRFSDEEDGTTGFLYVFEDPSSRDEIATIVAKVDTSSFGEVALEGPYRNVFSQVPVNGWYSFDVPDVDGRLEEIIKWAIERATTPSVRLT